MTKRILETTAATPIDTTDFEQKNDRTAKFRRFGKRALQASVIAAGGLSASGLALQATDYNKEMSGIA